MNKIAYSSLYKVFMLLAGYAASIACARGLIKAYDNYMQRYFKGFLRMDAPLSVAFFAAFMVLLLIPVWKAKTAVPPAWRKMDLLLVAIPAYCVIMLSVFYTRYEKFVNFEYVTDSLRMLVIPYATEYLRLLLIPFFAYTSAAVFLMELAARLRDRRLGLHLAGFFRKYPPPRSLIGALTAVLLSVLSFYLFIVFPVGAFRGRLDLPILLIIALSMCILLYFCQFIYIRVIRRKHLHYILTSVI